MESFKNIVIKTREEAERFSALCREKGIVDFYEKEDAVFPHFRVIHFSDAFQPVAYWSDKTEWKDGIFTTGIGLNGGGLYGIDEAGREIDEAVRLLAEACGA